MGSMLEAETRCKLCDHTQFAALFDREFQVLLCRNCGLVFVENKDRDYRKYYSEEYNYRLDGGNTPDNVKRDQSVFKWVIGNLPQVEGLALMEVGCGAGFLLRRFKDYGFDVFGIEPNERAVEFAREMNGLKNVTRGMLEDYERGDLYDVVILIQTFEHLVDPLDSLLWIRDLMKEDSLLFIEVPNFFAPNGFYMLKLNGVDYPSPNHLFVYSRKTLSAFLRKAGFSLSKVSYTMQNLRVIARIDGEEDKGENIEFENYHKVKAYFCVLPIITKAIDVARSLKSRLMKLAASLGSIV